MPELVKLNPTVSLQRLRELKCKQCAQLLYTDLQLERHIRLHCKHRQPLLCGICGVTSTTRYYHVLHLHLCCQAFAKVSDLKQHRELHDKKKTFDQPSRPHSATSLAEPKIELSETSSDTTQNCTLDPSLQLKTEVPGPSTVLCVEDTASTSASPLPVLTTTVDTRLQLEGQKQRYLYDEHLRRHTGKPPFLCCSCSSTFKTLPGLRFHVRLHDKKHIVSGQPSGTALVEPKTEPIETALSSDTGQSAPPPLSKDRHTFLPPSPYCTPSSAHTPRSVAKRAAQTPPQLCPEPTPNIFTSFGLTSAFLEVKWNSEVLQETETEARTKKYCTKKC